MASTTTISCDKLSRLAGTPKCPLVVDVRTEGDFAADPRLVPGAVRSDHATVAAWAGDLRARPVVVICHAGAKLSTRGQRIRPSHTTLLDRHQSAGAAPLPHHPHPAIAIA